MQKNNREHAVLDYIRRVTMEKGYAPGVRNIGAALGLKGTSTVQMYLDRLCDYGYIRREVGKAVPSHFARSDTCERSRSCARVLVWVRCLTNSF